MAGNQNPTRGSSHSPFNSDCNHTGAACLQCAVLVSTAPESYFLEIRHRAGQHMRQRFFGVRDYRAAAAFALACAPRGNVYVSAAPRVRRGGSAEDVREAQTLWVDLDLPDGLDRFGAFRPAPSIILATGTPGHALGIWKLTEWISRAQVKPMNRKLAHALGGDLAATDVARVVRVAGTLNFKHDPPQPVRCVHVESVAYSGRELVGHLPDPPEDRRRSTHVAVPIRSDDPLRTIPATDYVPALTGREVDRDGKIRCPFHGGGDERTPSLQVYPDGGGWFCFGCNAGGDVYTLGALLYGLESRGAGFREIRQRLASDLLNAAGIAA